MEHPEGRRPNVYYKKYTLEALGSAKMQQKVERAVKIQQGKKTVIHTCPVGYQAFSTETSGIGYLIWLRLKMRPPVRMAVAARKAAPRSIP